QADRKRAAETELTRREQRREQLDIRPLPETSRVRYVESWRTVQADFVDDPQRAVAAADSLLQSVLAERGYPVENFEQRSADISVDHPRVVENYREGHRLAGKSIGGTSSFAGSRSRTKTSTSVTTTAASGVASGTMAGPNRKPTAETATRTVSGVIPTARPSTRGLIT